MQKIIFLLFFIYSGQHLSAQSSWFSDLSKHREEKDLEFKTSEDSPIPEETRTHFEGLKYYQPDNRFNLTAEFIRLKKPKTVWFMTSSGKEKEYVQFAQIRFKLFDKSYTLYAYYSEQVRSKPGLEKYVFVPFKDLTNLKGTYGGGRYLELSEPSEDIISLDFNMAFNPYCAYSDGYSCPKVPAENYLNLRIEAGEKVLYGDEK